MLISSRMRSENSVASSDSIAKRASRRVTNGCADSVDDILPARTLFEDRVRRFPMSSMRGLLTRRGLSARLINQNWDATGLGRPGAWLSRDRAGSDVKSAALATDASPAAAPASPTSDWSFRCVE